MAGRSGFNENCDYCNLGSSDPLPWPNQGEYGYGDAFALVCLKEISDSGFGLVQPGGCRPRGENRPGIVVRVVALVLEVTQQVSEDLRVGGEVGAVLLKLRPGLVVVQATIYPNPGCGSQWVKGGSDNCVGVAGGQGVERRVVGGADALADSPRRRFDLRRLRDKSCPSSGYEFSPIDRLRGLNRVLGRVF